MLASPIPVKVGVNKKQVPAHSRLSFFNCPLCQWSNAQNMRGSIFFDKLIVPDHTYYSRLCSFFLLINDINRCPLINILNRCRFKEMTVCLYSNSVTLFL